jgi:Putative transposase/Transposase zinc-binding domain
VPRNALEVADIFRAHGPTWREHRRRHFSLGQLKVMSAIEQCRSLALGGHALRCSSCAEPQIAYNSCRNRADWLAPMRQCEWVVYAKRPFAGPEQVLAYLSRYTHRVAIANSRLLALDARGVTFRWKDYREHGRTRYKTMSLATEEFMRRFLLHVLPSGFHRIRYYGFLANANRQRDIAAARDLLHQPAPTPPADAGDGRTDHDCPRPSFVCRHCMICIASINKTLTAAFCKIMPPQTPVASYCKTFHCRHDSPLLNPQGAAFLTRYRHTSITRPRRSSPHWLLPTFKSPCAAPLLILISTSPRFPPWRLVQQLPPSLTGLGQLSAQRQLSDNP